MNPGTNPAIIGVRPNAAQTNTCAPADEGLITFVVVFFCIIFFMVTVAAISYFFQRS